MKTKIAIVTTLLMFSSVNVAQAADENTASENRVDESERITVTWQNPKEFTDVKPTNGGRTKFRERTLNRLYEYLDELAETLPEGHKLTMTVSDLDLAGRVWPGNFVGFNTSSDVRLVKRIEIPRMDFSFELLDADGKVVLAGDEALKDMSFQDRGHLRSSSDPLRYEKSMLKRWFNKHINGQLLASN